MSEQSRVMMEYKGEQGSVEVSLEDNVLHGKILHIVDLVTFEAQTPEGLQQAFKQEVDGYLAFCEEEGVAPDKPTEPSDPERDALAAHVERLRQSGNRALFFAGAERWKYKWSQAVEEGPEISLARRDALKQAEVLDRAAGTGGHMIDPRELRHQAAELRDEAAELRRKAEKGE